MPFFVFFSTVFTDVGTAFTMSDTPPRVDTPPPDVEPIADDEYSPPPRDGPSDAAAAGVAGATGERPPKASRSASSPQNCALLLDGPRRAQLFSLSHGVPEAPSMR